MGNLNFQKFFSIGFSIAIAFLIFFCIFLPASLIVHETGHVLGGAVYDVFTGRSIQNYTFTIRICTASFCIPRQTGIPNYPDPYYPAPMILGGPFTFVFFITLIIALIYATCDFETKKYLPLIPIYVFISAIINDYFCGTDNLSQKTLLQCQDNVLISIFFSWHFLLLIAIFSIILYPFVFAILEGEYFKKE